MNDEQSKSKNNLVYKDLIMRTENERLAVVENEVKHIREDVAGVKDSVDQLPNKLTDIFDSRYVQKEDFKEAQNTINEMAETIEPFTKLRKRLWLAVITAVIGVGVVQFVILQQAQSRIESIEIKEG